MRLTVYFNNLSVNAVTELRKFHPECFKLLEDSVVSHDRPVFFVCLWMMFNGNWAVQMGKYSGHSLTNLQSSTILNAPAIDAARWALFMTGITRVCDKHSHKAFQLYNVTTYIHINTYIMYDYIYLYYMILYVYITVYMYMYHYM